MHVQAITPEEEGAERCARPSAAAMGANQACNGVLLTSPALSLSAAHLGGAEELVAFEALQHQEEAVDVQRHLALGGRKGHEEERHEEHEEWHEEELLFAIFVHFLHTLAHW